MTEPQEPRDAATAHLTTEELSDYAFSPETAPAGLMEHVEGCARCATELADLRSLLTELAALPEPELPESVAIRMDAAVARAWQEVDAEAEADAEYAAARTRTPRRFSWRKVAIPLGSLSLIALAGVGIGVAVSHSSSGSSATSSAGAGSAAQAPMSNQALTDPTALAWVRSVLPTEAPLNSNSSHESPKAAGQLCADGDSSALQRAGYTVVTTSHRAFDGQPATLVVYRNAQEPASPTDYAIVYAGSCPTSASVVLAEGSVSR